MVLAGAAACGNAENIPEPGRTQALEAVVEVERSFARLASDATVQQAFLAYAADSATVFRPGPVNARAWLEQHPMPADLALRWEPAFVDVSAAGDLGYTTGPWQSARRGRPDSIAAQGRYVTIWEKSPTGWHYLLDFGVSIPAPAAVDSLIRAPAPATPAANGADDQAAAESLRIADEDLNAAARAQGEAAWDQYADAALQWLRDGLRARGEARPDSAPIWDTAVARVARSHDLGFTWGGAPAADSTGAGSWYLRIWRRHADGSWRVVLDAAAGG
jgi:ketosteroid isomerase-like protein